MRNQDATPEPAGSAGLQYPIVRVLGSQKKRRWIRITRTGLATGHLPDDATDADVVDHDEVNLQFSQIRSVWYDRLGSWDERFWRRRYTIEHTQGDRLTFELWERETENVDRALVAGLGGLFNRVERKVRWSVSDVLVRGAFVLAAVSLALVLVNWWLVLVPMMIAWIAAMVMIHETERRGNSHRAMMDQRQSYAHRRIPRSVRIPVLTVGYLLLPLGPFIGLFVGLRWLALSLSATLDRRRRRRRRGGAPFRSPALGWALKLLGLSYAAAVLCSSEVDYVIGKLAETKTTIAAYGPALVYGLLGLPAIGLITLGARLCLRTFTPGRHPDPRPPVVYLRSFDDDGKGTLQPCTEPALLHGISLPQSEWGRVRGRNVFSFLDTLNPMKLLRMMFDARRVTVEDTLAAGLKGVGPFVAIGRPGERLATSGADRMYVSDGDWQRAVLDALARCRAVVLQPGSSEGVRWEMERVFEGVPICRVLLSMARFRGRCQEYEEFRGWLAERYGVDLPVVVPLLAEACFVYFDADRTAQLQKVCYRSPWVWSFTNNAVDEARTFDSFVRGLDGQRRSPPQPPVVHEFQWLSRVVAVAMALLFTFLMHGAIAVTDGVRETFRPAATPNAVVRVGRNFPYELHLNSGWSDSIAREFNQAQHELVYRDGKTRLVTFVDVGTPSGAGPRKNADELRATLWKDGRSASPLGISVSTERAEKRQREGYGWLEMKFHQQGVGVSQWVWAWVHETETKTLTVMLTATAEERFNTVAEDAFAGVVITGTPGLIGHTPGRVEPTPAWSKPTVVGLPTPERQPFAEAMKGKAVEYKGKALPYTVTLPEVWKEVTKSPDHQVREVENLVGQGLPELIPYELSFRLKGVRYAEMGIMVIEEEVLPEEHEAVGLANVTTLEDLVRKARPQARFKLTSSRTVVAHGRTWGAFEVVMTAPLEGGMGLTRYATQNGRTIMLVANFVDEPDARRFVDAAMDSVRLPPPELPPGYKEQWTGRTVVIHRQADIRFHCGKNGRTLGSLSYTVKKDADGRLWVDDADSAGWFDKTAAVPLNEAEAYFAGRLKKNADDVAAWAGRGETHHQLKKYSDAEKCWAELIRLRAGDAAWHYNRGLSREHLGKYRDAATDFAEALKLDPAFRDAATRRADALRLNEDWTQAAVAYDEVIRLSPKDAILFFHRGECWRQARWPKEAIDDYTKAILISPNYAEAYFQRGYVQHLQGKHEKALADYTECARHDKSHWAAWCNSGLILAAQGKHDDAVLRFDEAIKLRPNDPEAYYERGRSHVTSKNSRRAIADFETVLKFDPKHSGATADLAWRLSVSSVTALRDGKRAVELATKACEASKYANAWHLQVMAAAHAEAGDFAAAEKWQKKVVATLPDDTSAKARLDSYKLKVAVHEE